MKAGTLLWEFKTGSEVLSSPAIGLDGTVYVGSQDKKVYALDGKSGAKQWEFETGKGKNQYGASVCGVISSPAIGLDDTVYVGSKDKKVLCPGWGNRSQAMGI